MENNQVDTLTPDLENFVCDLLALAKNQPALQLLFRLRKGTWVRVRDLSVVVPGLAKEFKTIDRRTESDLMATWLDYPSAPPGGKYAVVMFFLEDSLWSKVAIFNRKTLPKPALRKISGAKASH